MTATLLTVLLLSIQPSVLFAVQDAAVAPVERRDTESLSAALTALQQKYPAMLSVSEIGRSAGKRPITLLTLSSDLSTASTRPTVLLVAGIDGPRWSGTEAALVAAETLLHDQQELLKSVTFLVVPRANPDAAESFAHGARRDYSGDGIVHDNDRDGRFEEDQPRDMNGDGLITQMRSKSASPPWSKPTLVIDPAEPRLMRAADAKKGEIPVYTVWTEGIDTDGDGRIAEDWLGGIDPDRNFPHQWPEFEDEAGAYPLIGPESKALAELVLTHPEIFAALVLGRHDTVVNAPDGKARTPGGMPVMIDEADAAVYGEIAKSWREITGQTRTTTSDSGGSFVSWMNAQRGVPTFASTLWGRPDAPAEPETPAAADDAKDAGKIGAVDATPEAKKDKKKDGKKEVKPADEESAQWLAYSDRAAGGSGFVLWTPIQHPQLREAEVGGWVPGFRENPPIAEIAPLGKKCAEFLAKLTDARPAVKLAEPTIVAVGPGLWRIDTALSNTGRLPTVMRGGRADAVTPAHVVRVRLPIDQVKSGRANDIVRGIDPGQVRPYSWLVSTQPDQVVTIELLFNGSAVTRWAFKNGEKVDAPPPTEPVTPRAKGATR